METKVILMIFGVILLLAAIFFFFKSFASHERRMQEEQRLRVEMERKKLDDERARAGRPLTPEEVEQKRRLAEARLKAQEARRKAAEAARSESERKRLEEEIARKKRIAEAQKRANEEARLAEALRLKQAEEAKKRAEEARRKAAEAAEAQKALARKQQAQAAAAELKDWANSVIRQTATAYPVRAVVPIVQGTGSARTYSFPRSTTGGRTSGVYSSPDAIPGFLSWPGDKMAAFCKRAMLEHVSHQDPQVKPPAVFAKIGFIEDVEALKDVHRGLAAQTFKAQDAVSSMQKNQAAHRNLINMALRQYDKLDRQETELERTTGATRTTSSHSVGTKARSKTQLLNDIRDEKRKQTTKMQTEVVSYWKALNEGRGAAAAVNLLNQAKRLVAARLAQLGVEDFGGTAAAATSTPRKGDDYKVYVLQDGTEIKAYTVMKMGDQLAIKNEKGELKTVKASDVKEIRKP